MVAKADLEARQAECESVEDFVNLAREALAEPADQDYARELLQEAEMKAQFPADQVMVAELFAEMGDREHAAEIYESAADMCFDGMEYATVGASLAATLGDRERGAELFRQGVDEVKESAQILTLADWAESKLGDSELSKELYAKVEEGCKSLDDFKSLAKTVLETGDAEGAKAIFQKAQKFVTDIAGTVDFAAGAREMFGDEAWVRSLLEGVEGDAQFPGQFVQLAQGFKELLGDEGKVDELLEQGAEFAMSGEELLDLADGYWNLKQDGARAAEYYEKAMPDVNDRAKLLELAKKAGGEIGNLELAKKFYAKAKEKVTTPGDLTKLADTVFEDLGDKEFAAELYAEAEEKIGSAHDLLGLAGRVLSNLGDQVRASGIYRKALDLSTDFDAVGRFLDSVREQMADDKGLLQQALEKMEQTAENSPELIKVQGHVLALLQDSGFARRLLEQAEEKVTSLGELKAVVAAVEASFGDDGDWLARLQEKVEKREANQALYDEFQAREAECTNALQYLHLANEVMTRLDDPYYGRKLYAAAEELLDKGAFDLSQYGELIRAIDSKLGDREWVERLVEAAASKTKHFSEINRLARLAASLSDREQGKALARRVLEKSAAELEALDSATTADYIKLARSVTENIGDTEWAKKLLEQGMAKAADYLELSALARTALEAGDQETATALLEKAAETVQTPSQLQKLAGRLLQWGLDRDLVRKLYEKGEQLFTGARQKLEWAEGILAQFGDREWAAKAYDAIASLFTDPADRAAYELSRKIRLTGEL